MATILIADDDRAIRLVLSQALIREGHDVQSTEHAATLWQWVKDGRGDVVITDVVMPDENGLELVPRIKKLRPTLKVVVMSAQNTLLTAVRATERGAFEYLPKPFDLREVVAVVERALEKRQELPAEGEAVDGDLETLPLIGRSSAMQEVYRVLARVMGTDLTVMLYGESGTGKELVAKALHTYGKRRNGAFVAVNMAAIPKDLIESELFGHEKGAFTGAVSRASGRFEQAAGGTLFLDEIGDMPVEAQTRLLRVLQEGEYTSVGGRAANRADARIVAATHRDLLEEVRRGRFREDLYYRLSVVPVRLPPLRERRDDIPELVGHFLRLARKDGLPAKTMDQEAMEDLKFHTWPGNVRELENVVRRLVVLYGDEAIHRASVRAELTDLGKAVDQPIGAQESLSEAVERHLQGYFSAHQNTLPASGLYNLVLKEVERPLIELSLAATRGNQIKAADLLGLNRNTLRKKIRELDIRVVRGLK
ncbi:MAG: nitrogen regulation protein NR(I) [Pseudomonadota bacterium]